MAHRQRTSLVWTPIWEGPIKGWATNHIRRNIWRCDPIHSFDDLIQDAYLVFLRVCQVYPRVMEPQHFMSLFKTSLRNWVHDQSRYVKRKREVHDELPQDVSELYSGRIGELTNSGYLFSLMSEAPEELRLAFAALENKADEVRATVGSKRENLNARFRRVLGLGHNFDFSGSLRELLTQEA